MDSNRDLSRFFKDGKTKLPFKHIDYYPSVTGRLIISLKNKIFDNLYPVNPWLFGTIWSASTAYFYHNTKSAQTSIAKGLAISIIPVALFRSILHLFLFRIWGICYFLWKKLAPKPGLLTCETLLPRQPVPPLKQSLSRYLESMKPLLLDDEYEKLSQLAAEFETNEGRKLQFYTWLYSWYSKNYISEFWQTYVYLTIRENLIINSSICSGETLMPPKGCTQSTRAGHCAYLAVISMLRYATREQKPLYEGFMCSIHYTRLYASRRIPAKDIDYLVSEEYSRHLVVIRNGCFYKVHCFDPKTNKLYSVLDFIQIIDDILKRDDKPTEIESKIASLTLDERNNWAKNRQRFFLDNPTNRKFIKEIESAIMVFVLDDSDYNYEPENFEITKNLYSSMLLGDGKNRWLDKVIHYMFGKNGTCGAFTEHSVGDGAEFVVAMEEVLGNDVVYLNYPEMNESDFIPRKGLKLADRLEVKIFDDMPAEIERCFTAYQKIRDDVDFASMINLKWGKGRIKKTKCSPDAFFQMALQLAYFKDQQKFTSTYEAAAARFFKNTRTETIRTVSTQSCSFVSAMLKEPRDKKECEHLLRKACEIHQYKTKLSMTGGGFDRHLFVLYVMSKYFNVDSPFLNQYVKQEWKLSTSQSPLVTNIMKEDVNNLEQCYLGGAFQAVTKDGYGICYRFIGEGGMVAHISSYHSGPNTDSARFQSHIEDSLEEMILLFE